MLFLVGCSRQEETEKRSVSKYVKIEKVSNVDTRDKLVFNGLIKEKSLSNIAFRVGGLLNELKVNTGEYVLKGQLVASIDKRDYQVQLNANQAQYEQLKEEYDRYEKLFEQQKIPANSYEKIKSGFLMAKSAYENSKNQLEDTELKAPLSGYIHEKFVERFQTIGPGQAVVSIVDLSQLEIVISIPENQLAKIKNSSKSYLNVKNANISEFPVSVLSIGEKAAEDGLFEMKFVFDNNKNLEAFPGMTAEIIMLCNQGSKIIDIPISAVFYENNSTCVWVLNQKTKHIKKRNISLKNISSDGRIEVLSGLNVNEIIVTAGVHSLFDDQLVEPIKPQSSTNIGGLL